jgi:hypothetical protein
MSNINDAFPSKYLKANDLKGNRVTVTMSHVDYETIAEERKAVLFFRGKEKGLVLNKTNASMIVELTGTTETDDWMPFVSMPLLPRTGARRPRHRHRRPSLARSTQTRIRHPFSHAATHRLRVARR